MSESADPFRNVTVQWLAQELRCEQKSTDWECTRGDFNGEVGTLDVRLQVYPDGDAYVRSGSSDYDQDHHGFWGASSIAQSDDWKELIAVAIDLIEQAQDQYAMSREVES